jgi:hypothetical protein
VSVLALAPLGGGALHQVGVRTDAEDLAERRDADLAHRLGFDSLEALERSLVADRRVELVPARREEIAEHAPYAGWPPASRSTTLRTSICVNAW